ncbi:MAG: type II secretion system secretin GspD [Thermodesulfobacteriota bacterium]
MNPVFFRMRLFILLAACGVMLLPLTAIAQPGPPPGPPGGTAGEVWSTDIQDVVLNFDNADIYEVITSIGDILDIDYIIAPGVSGKVNIRTRGEVSREDLLEIFEAILKVSGAVMTREGDLYHIGPMAGVPHKLLMPRPDREGEITVPRDDIIFQIVRLNHVPVAEITNVIRPFVAPAAVLIPYERMNTFFLVDFAGNVERILKLVELFDVSMFKRVNIKLYQINEANVEDVSKELEGLFSAVNVSTKSTKGVGINFIPIVRLNSLLVITSLPEALPEVDRWVRQLDHEGTEEKINTYIYHVKNGIAEELTEIMVSVFSEGDDSKKTSAKAAKTPAPKQASAAPPRAGQPLPGFTVGKVEFVPYATTNTIIIKSTARDYKLIKRIMMELDIIPRQVLIEVFVAEVTLSDSTKFGIEFALRGGETSAGEVKRMVGTSFGLPAAGTLGGGLTASLLTGDLTAVLNAIATENDVNILAAPRILARDGKEASIDIGEEVPLVATRTLVEDNRTEVSIERRDTGTILKVTPHINTTGLVTLDISLELSNAIAKSLEGQEDISVFQRRAVTSMVVQDGETVIIGGLINEQDDMDVKKVPILGDIFLIKHLFRSWTRSSKKTELLLLITPRVMRNTMDAHDITREFIDKLEGIKEKFKDREEISEQ